MRIETLSDGEITRQASGRLGVDTRGQGLTEITDAVAAWVSGTASGKGF